MYGPWEPNFPNPETWPGFGFQFAFLVLPTVIFFSSLMSVLYHAGIMQKIIKVLTKIMQKTMGTSGAETASISANIFVGQTESPLVIKPFISKMLIKTINRKNPTMNKCTIFLGMLALI